MSTKQILLNCFTYKSKNDDKKEMVCFDLYDPSAKQNCRIFKPIEFVAYENGEMPSGDKCPYIVETDLHLRSYVNKEGKQVYQPDVGNLKVVKILNIDKL